MHGDEPEFEAAESKGRPLRSSASSAPRYKVSDLMRGGREMVLEHDGADYLLRITANGRLILTK
jgi:hemin uptake protein HemP